MPHNGRMTGHYELAHQVLLDRWAEIVRDATSGLLVQVGVLLAALRDDVARQALMRAADTASQFLGKFMALHRLAAAEIKRFNHPLEGERILAELDFEIDECQTGGLISPGDGDTLRSVTANLRALSLMRQGKQGKVRDEIARARDLNTLDGLDRLVAGEASRYGAQERINLAQVLNREGDVREAVDILEENVEYCTRHNDEYVGEALTALAYGQFLLGHFDDSAASATAAAQRIAFEASPVRLRAAREICAAAYHRADNVSAAREMLRSMEEDPLGIEISRPEPMMAA